MYRDGITTSEASCYVEYPYYTSSKVQNANKPEVWLDKMYAELLAVLAGNTFLMTSLMSTLKTD